MSFTSEPLYPNSVYYNNVLRRLLMPNPATMPHLPIYPSRPLSWPKKWRWEMRA